MPADDYYPPQSGINQGQSHYYSVFLRGNGEAVVSFKAQFKNSGNNPLTSLTYFIPNTSTFSNVVVYQRINSYDRPCYYPQLQSEETEVFRQNDSKAPSISISPIPTPISYDQTYQEPTGTPCLDQSGYYGSGSSYLKADSQLDGNVLTITLPHTIYVSDSVNVIITYRSLSYAKENFPGSFNYEFETLRSDSGIESIQAGISVEEGYVLKGATGRVEYLKNFSEFVPPSASEGNTGLYNERFDTLYNRIGQGNLYKYASHLAPMESYTVSGSYADSIWKLYFREILFGLLVITIIGLFILTIVIKILRILTHDMKNTESPKGSFWMRLSVNQKSLLIASSGSMLGSTLAVIYTLFIFLFVTKLGDYFYLTNGLEAIFFILIIVISFAVYSVFLLLPSIIIAVKRGIAWGITALILTICWMITYLLVIFILGQVLFDNNNRIMKYPSNVGTGAGDQYIE